MHQPSSHRHAFLSALLCSALLATTLPLARADDDGIPNIPSFHDIKSIHYDTHTDINGPFAKELVHRMDTMYGEYEKELPGFKQPPGAARLPALLFSKDADYVKWTGSPHTAGVFVMADHPFLAGQLAAGRDDLRKTLQHEAFHQFAYFAISRDLPPWINEGLAQVFEEGVWTGNNFWMGQIPPRRVRMIQADIHDHRLIPFKKFMAITLHEWNSYLGSDDNRDASNYNQAWAMAQFLMENGGPVYKKKLMNFLQDMHNGDDAATAAQREFKDGLAFQNDFARWVVNLRPSVGATMVERQRVLGEFLIFAHKDGIHFPTVENFRDTIVNQGERITYKEGRFHWDTAANPIEYFQDAFGRVFSPQNLFFDRTIKAPIPDLVCHASRDNQFRTHFYNNPEGKLECEVLLQQPGQRGDE